MKQSPIHIPNNMYEVLNWMPDPDVIMDDQETDAWFDYQFYQNPNPSRSFGKTNQVICPFIPKDSYNNQIKNIRKRKSNKVPVFMHVYSVQLYPTDEQKNILNYWFEAFRKMYNITIYYLRKNSYDNGKFNLDKACEAAKFYPTRDALVDQKNQIIDNMEEEYKIYAHELVGAIQQAVSNYNSCLTNLRNGNIRKFRIKEIPPNKRKKIINIQKESFRRDTFCQKIFKSMDSSFPLSLIDATSTLQYDIDAGTYTLFVPEGISKKTITKNVSSIGIDLGSRTFVTGFSNDSIITICSNARDKPVIKNNFRKIDTVHYLLNDNTKNLNDITDPNYQQYFSCCLCNIDDKSR